MQILYGKNPVFEAIKAGRRKVGPVFYADPKNFSIPDAIAQKIVSRDELGRMAKTPYHQGIVAQAGEYPYDSLDKLVKKQNSFLVMCDSLTDPQNFGALCRSAYCFGVDGVIINKDRSVEVTPAVCKASAGAVEHLSIVRVTNLVATLTQLKKQEYWVYATAANAEATLDAVKPSAKMVLILGSEGEGVRRLVGEQADFKFSIPMKRAFDSLNVAQAATICMYEMSKKPITS